MPCDYMIYKGELRVDMEYYVRTKITGKPEWHKMTVRQRLTEGSRVQGVTIQNEETQEQYKAYRVALGIMRDNGLLYVKNK